LELLGRRGNLLTVIRRHVMETSRWLGRRQCRHDAGCKIDFNNLCESCHLRSVKLDMSAEYRAFTYGMSFVKQNIILNALLWVASIWSVCIFVNRCR